MEVTFEQLQEALVDERITWIQFIMVLQDNFGMEKTLEILKQNGIGPDIILDKYL
jgi:hypothetical protein